MRYLYCAVFALFASYTFALDPTELNDEAQLDRYRHLAAELRCPKCQNQNLIDSDSQISGDLKQELVRLIVEDKSDDEIKSHMVSMYGDFILYRPPVQPNTMVLWIGPFAMVGIGLLVFAVILIRRRRVLANADESEAIENEDFVEDADELNDDEKGEK